MTEKAGAFHDDDLTDEALDDRYDGKRLTSHYCCPVPISKR